MTTTGTWRKAQDGEDVYVQSDGWVWSHVMQGWFYSPDLTLQVPAPPLATRLRDEKHRLTHGWPPLLKAFMPGNGVRGISAVFCWGYRLAFLYLWAVVIFGWGIHHVVRSWQRFFYGIYKKTLQVPVYNENGYWYDEQHQDARNVLGVMFIVLLSLALWYLLYMNLCYTVDSHKGNLMFGGLMAHTAYQTLKKARAHDAMVAVRDGTRAAGGH